MMTELLPCPFCGGEAGINYQIDDCDRLTHYFEAQCAVCDATGAPYIPRANAIAAWNRRASVAAPPREPTEAMLRAALGVWQSNIRGANEYNTAVWQAMLDASPAERVEGSTMDGGTKLQGAEEAPPGKRDSQASTPPSTLPTDALTDEECDAAIFRSRFNVANAGTFPQRVDYDRALYRDAYRAGFAARVAALGALLQRLLS